MEIHRILRGSDIKKYTSLSNAEMKFISVLPVFNVLLIEFSKRRKHSSSCFLLVVR